MTDLNLAKEMQTLLQNIDANKAWPKYKYLILKKHGMVKMNNEHKVVLTEKGKKYAYWNLAA